MTAQRSTIAPFGSPAASPSRMTYIEFLDNSPMHKYLWFLVIGVGLANLLDGFDFQITSFALPGIAKAFALNHALAGTVPSAGNFGMLVGAVSCALISDRIGRIKTMQWVLFIFAFGSFLSAIAPGYTLLLVARFIAGVGIGAEPPAAIALLAEYAPRRYRHLFILVVPVLFGVGFLSAALVSVAMVPVWGWRSLYWVGILPAFVIVLVRYYLPESIRFLLSKGRIEEAGRICREMARRAGMSHVELVPPPMAAAQLKLTFRQQLAVVKNIRRPLLGLGIVFFCYYVQNWGVYAWLPSIFVKSGYTLSKSFHYTLLIYCMTPLAQCNSSFFQERWNRKWALFFVTVVGSLFFVIFGMSFQYKWPIYVTVGAQMLQMLFAHGIVTIVNTLAAELFPTPVRAFGIGILQGVGRAGAVVGPITIGLLLNFGSSISQVLYILVSPMLIATALALLLVNFDPRQRSLENINAELHADKVPLSVTAAAH